MKHTFVTATELKNTLGAVLDQAHKCPVGITKHGRLSHVVMDFESYEALDPKAAEAAKKAIRAEKIAAAIKDGHERYGSVFEHLAK